MICRNSFVLITIALLFFSACSENMKNDPKVNADESYGSLYERTAQSESASTYDETQIQEHYDSLQPAAPELTAVPANYYQSVSAAGHLERFSYSKKNYAGNGEKLTKNAMIYLPNGYDSNDNETQYDILYLQHGAYGSENTWLGSESEPTSLKYMLDNLIASGDIKPLIVVTPYIDPGDDWYDSTCPAFFEELSTDLMPAVEKEYHTFADDVSPEGFKSSRGHRIFGGFSMGGAATWFTFLNGLDYFAYFMPMSGDCWQLGTLAGGRQSDETAQILSDTASASGYSKQEYYIFAATGSNDVAYGGMNNQIAAMKKHTETFDFSDTGFSEGNLIYYTVKGNYHDYQYTYEYIYNGLRCFVGK